MKIPKLTQEEIQTLQVDAALRLLGEYNTILSDLNNQISQAIIAKGKADIKLQTLKNDKSSVVEMSRNLKVMCNNG